MTTGHEMLISAGIVGAMIPIALGFVYWLALDMAKGYTDQEIREAKKELREYARDQR